MKLPILGRFDHVMLGGSLEAVWHGLRVAENGTSVAIVCRNTFLAEDICEANCYEPAQVLARAGGLPDNAVIEGGTVHPGNLKNYLEDMCRERGIQLFYFMWKIDVQEQPDGTLLVLAAELFGVTKEQAEHFLSLYLPAHLDYSLQLAE